MTPMDRGEYAPEDFAGYLAEQRAQMRGEQLEVS